MLKANKTFLFISKLIQLLVGFRSNKVDDAQAIKDLQRLESVCIEYNILPNGFSQDQSVTPSKWTKTKSILYSSLIIVNITHLLLLSVSNLSNEWLLIFGDFLCSYPGRRFFWSFWLYVSVFGEVLRHFWIYLVRNGNLATLKLYHSIYLQGFKSKSVSMNQTYCQKFSFIAANLTILWLRIIFLTALSLAPIFVIIVQTSSHLPKTLQQFICIYFWLLITYLGLVCTLSNIMLTGGIVTVHLSYFYFKAAHLAQIVQDFVRKRKILDNIDYFSEYKVTVDEIIKYQNEIEQLNIRFRNWLIFLYFGISFTSNFGFYIAVIVHIDSGFLDLFIASISVVGSVSIGACSYTNGIILTKMCSYCKNLRRATRRLQLNVKSFIKGTDLQDRLVRTDIAFTIGKILHMTTEVFVIYLLENISLIMMFTLNFK
uniref:Gustatory receptor n=1 Tax=Tetranychus urticae TaxID=32264 RepID=T1L0Z5_TETUR